MSCRCGRRSLVVVVVRHDVGRPPPLQLLGIVDGHPDLGGRINIARAELVDAAVANGAEMRIGKVEGVETEAEGEGSRVTGVKVAGESVPASPSPPRLSSP